MAEESEKRVPDRVDAIADQGRAALQAVVDEGETKTADLRAQIENLSAQQSTLSAQISALRAQVAEIEGEEVRRAREALSVVDVALESGASSVLGGPPFPRGRRF